MIKHIFTLIWNKKGANSLVLVEIFLAFLVLFAVLSFVFYNVDRLAKPLGFETENMKYVRYGDLEHMDSTQRADAWKMLKSSLEELDLVEQVSLGHDVSPFGGSNWCHGNDDNGYHLEACYAVVDYDFISTNGMKIVQGRDFSEDDLNSTYPVMIANQQFMDDTYGELRESMIDSIVIFNQQEHQLIGVVEEFKYNGEFEESANRMLLLSTPSNSRWFRMTNAYLRLDPRADVAFEEKISNTVESVLKTTSFVIQDAPLLRRRANLESWIPIVALLSMCVFLCLNVALGLFGVLSYSISKRKAEVGLRRALGAHATSITSQFTMEIVFLALLAILVGVFFAIQIPILKVIDTDQTIFYRGIGFAALVIILVVTICAIYPSFQASRIHPATALRED